ncbi:MAG TPA: helix-turn-helix transcriptional regulator, partial [Firmicutes bacterium]|nr:helix-turn-helix transcriptional regulator [Bacillota bacterium]
NSARNIGWEAKLKGHLLELLVMLGREFRQQGQSIKSPRYFPPSLIYKALSFMEENFHCQLRLEDISSAVHLSPDYFSRVFRELIGLSPMEYLKILRIAKACEMLSGSDLPISQVAVDTGFLDNNYFSRVFRQIVGESPSRYRGLRPAVGADYQRSQYNNSRAVSLSVETSAHVRDH